MDSGDGGAGWCMEGGRGVDRDINRILLKYRPIAPKPVVGGSDLSISGSSLLTGKRTKRRYVRVSSGRCKNKDKNKEDKRVVTLQLLPERVDSEGYGDAKNSDLTALERDNNNNNFDVNSNHSPSDGVFRSIVSSRVAESWIVVESVEDNLYANDHQVMWNDNFVQHQLEGDTYPGFISRAESGRVEWVNEAYRRMVGCGSSAISHSPLIVVWLKIKEEFAEVISRVGNVFSCWVKVQYNNNEDGRRGVSMVLPCDAWRVENGGFAWRLDARAALCLGFVTDSSDGRFHPSY